MYTPLDQRTKELLSKHLDQAHTKLEQTDCLDCIHYCDGCTIDICPGHAVTE